MNKIKQLLIKSLLKIRPREKWLFDLADPVDRDLLNLKTYGYLADSGWVESRKSSGLIPEPWFSYPANAFLNEKLPQHPLRVLEFGSGGSSLYFLKKGYTLRSVEHDENWFNQISRETAKEKNFEYMLLSLDRDGHYCRAGLGFSDPDILVIDGRDRINCLRKSLALTTDKTLIIFDDSQRSGYAEAFSILKEQGYKHLPFWGIAAATFETKCTSFFYKTGNCLNI